MMQYPMFHPDSLPEINYGSYGYLVGHELTHMHTAHIYLIPGLEETSALATEHDKSFEAQYKCFEEQYGGQREEFTGLLLNANLTLGEDIADNAGVKLAYWAWQVSCC